MEIHRKSNIISIINMILITCLHVFINGAYGYSVEPIKGGFNGVVKTLFVFGDSTVDPGNNNYIPTVVKGNFLPYGSSYKNQEPTGRFTDGKLTTDFIGSYLGIKDYIPPYLDPNLSLNDMVTGVSFASAGTGFDPVTSTTNSVISMSKQLEYFAEYKSKVESQVGKKRAAEIVAEAAYVVSCGTNDVVQSRPVYHGNDYQRYLLDLSNKFIQGLLSHGAQHVVVVGLPPVGCLPVVISLNSPFMGLWEARKCVGFLNSFAAQYNRQLQEELNRIQRQHQVTARGKEQIVVKYADIYQSLDDQIHHPKKYGYVSVDRGCCGTGLMEGAFLCNPGSMLCERRSEYLFWDAIHPTEKAYYYIFKGLQPFVDNVVQEVYGHN